MEYSIKSEVAEAKIKSKGAELVSLKEIKTDTEFMWEANPEFWGKTSPVLFPFIGFLKDNKYIYNGKEYKMSKHGFARDNNFEVIERQEGSISFLFSSNEKTREVYPFDFDFIVKYSLEKSKLDVEYIVINKSNGKMYFQVGGHPAFSTPTNEELSYEDYYLEFDKMEKSDIIHMEENLISEKKTEYLENEKIIRLNRDIFNNDALMFDDLRSTKVYLKNSKNTNTIKFDFSEFPYLAFWAVPGADFVCIEPWFGINDRANSNNILEEKLGIECIDKDKKFYSKFSIEINV